MSFNILIFKIYYYQCNMSTDSEIPTKKGSFHFQGYNRFFIYYVIFVVKKYTTIKLVKTIVYIAVMIV